MYENAAFRVFFHRGGSVAVERILLVRAVEELMVLIQLFYIREIILNVLI